MRNKLLTVFGSVLMMAGVCFPVYASEEDVYEVGEIQSENQQLMNVDENGNVTAVDTDAPEQELANMPMMMTNDLARDISEYSVN